jgi:hypothetical protein
MSLTKNMEISSAKSLTKAVTSSDWVSKSRLCRVGLNHVRDWKRGSNQGFSFLGP